MATSGPGATNLVTCIADAKLDSIPLIAITGQVKTAVIGTDAFQETPIVEVCRGITKHHYLVTDVNDLARVMREAFHIATTGRPGPVLIDVPKDVQQAQIVPDYDAPMNLPGYHVEDRKARPEQIAQVAAAIKRSKRPVIYAGGGVMMGDASGELRELASEDQDSGDHDADGPGRVSRRRSAVARHARHARQRVRQLRRRPGRPAAGLRRAVRRSRDGQGLRVRQARQDRAHRHRSVGDQQEQRSPHSDRQRHQVRAGRAEQDRRSARGPRPLARADRRLEEERSRSSFGEAPTTRSPRSTPSTSCGS